MKTSRVGVLRVALLASYLACSPPAAAYTLLHSHAVPESSPQAPLVSDGAGNLYGTASTQGPFGNGVVFRIRTDGTGYLVLHAFAGGSSDGAAPKGTMVLDGSGTLYGTTYRGGPSDYGTVFKVKTDGTGYLLLHAFSPASTDGQYPEGGLTLDALGNLYGTTSQGGPTFQGTVFKIRTDGAGFELLHVFAGPDGASPSAAVTLDGAGNLYGTASAGGASNLGTFFRLGTDGLDFTLLRSFAGGPADGAAPRSALLLDGATLYGTTNSGGASGRGTLFTVQTDGNGFAVLHSFAGSSSDGASPYMGNLVRDAVGKLYGTTYAGGAWSAGTVYTIDSTGIGFALLHTFAGGASDGKYPMAGLTLDGAGNIFGTAYGGGTPEGGTVFALTTTGTGFTLLRAFGMGGLDGANPSGALILDGTGELYGTTDRGGASGLGAVFRMQKNGTAVELLHSFSGADGRNPQAGLVADGTGRLYGTTTAGGAFDYGTVFALRTDGTDFTVLHSFAWLGTDGVQPQGALILDGAGNLYGTTTGGGASGRGTVYKIGTNGLGFALLHSFAGPPSESGYPGAELVLDGSGYLFGTAYGTDGGDPGAVFKVKTDGLAFAIVHPFAGGPADGANPRSGLMLDAAGNLYGTTTYGGAFSNGTLFHVKGDGTDFGIVHSFAADGSEGMYPMAGPILDASGHLYGTTNVGGDGPGTVFRVGTNGSGYTRLHAFPPSAAQPRAGLILDGAGDLYGTAPYGGAGGVGTEFKLASLTWAPPVTAVVSGGGTICAGQSVDVQAALSGAGPWNLAWSDGVVQIHVTSSPAVRTLSPLASATYSVTTVWCASGTGTASGAAPVTVYPIPVAPPAFSNSPVCDGGTLMLFSGGDPGASYLWLGPNGFTSSTQNPSLAGAGAAAAGTYAVWVTLNGCTSSPGTTDVTVLPDTAIPVVTPSAPITIDQSTCCGAPGGATGATSTTLASFLDGGTATDDCDSNPVRIPFRVGEYDVTSVTCFEAGTTPVTFRFQDSSGKIGTANANVTVRLFGDLNLDRLVDPSDMVVLRAFFNFAISPDNPPFSAPLGSADLTHDGTVDPSDMVMLRAYFNFAVSCLAP